MARNSPANFNSDVVNFIAAVEMSFDSGAVRVWNGYESIIIDGEEYLGLADLLSISGFDETLEIAAKGATVAIAGFDSSVISIALQENYQNRAMRIMVGTLDAGVPDMYTIFRGRMDVMEINESGGTSVISVSAENRLIDLERARSSRYTSEDQKTYYPGDLGLDYVADLQDKSIDWGK